LSNVNIVIVGAGEVGRHLAGSLSSRQHNLCVIEVSEMLAAELDEQLDIQVLRGSGSSVTSLAEANIGECDLFLSLTSDDNTNLVSASVAKALGARRTIARVHTGIQREEWLFDFKSHFKIDYLFSSERLAAVELAKYVRNPEGVLVEELARGRIEMQQTVVTPSSAASGTLVGQLSLPNRVRVALIRRNSDNIIPTAQDVIQAGDMVTLFGDPLSLAQSLELLHPEGAGEEEVNVVIFGGGEYGFALAQMLEGKRYRVRIFERDARVCRELSDLLQRTVIINADATSLLQLREERVGDADFFVATTADDEDNVMTCLQARSLGTRYCLTLIHRADYADIVSRSSEQLGILGAVSPRVATNRDLLRFVTSEKFHVIIRLPGELELVEASIARSGQLAGRTVREIDWPAGSGLVALLQGQQALVPVGEDRIAAGDTIYAIVSPEARKAFVRLL
jgi:trk system potassium uptake protein